MEMAVIYEVKRFLKIKAWIMFKKSRVKEKGIKKVPVKWVFISKEETDGLIRLKSRNVVNGVHTSPFS